MDIAIFEDVTTESALVALEKEAETYTGLYVEMDQPDQRKFVKGKALLINEMLKKLDRARIEKSRDYKILVEAEAKSIKERLEKANEPFTLLIDEYKELREKQIAEEKVRSETKAMEKKIPLDHDEAILMNKMFEFEKAEKIREQTERDNAIAQQAAEDERERLAEAVKASENAAVEAVDRLKQQEDQAEIDRLAAIENAEREKQEAIDAEKQRQQDEKIREDQEKSRREADTKHRKTIFEPALSLGR